MSCEFENRCLNISKCYRCYGESLLKLPEDKIIGGTIDLPEILGNGQVKIWDYKTPG